MIMVSSLKPFALRRLVQGACLIGVFLLAMYALPAFASSSTPAGTCTWDPPLALPNPGQVTIMTNLVDTVSCILFGPGPTSPCVGYITNNVGQILYDVITLNADFASAIRVAATLYVIFYGVTFMLGMVQVTVLDFVMRVVKLGIVVWLTSPGTWTDFYSIVGVFFKDGTDWLIGQVSSIAVGGAPNLDPSKPFGTIDYVLSIGMSARMFVTLVALFFSGPYGLLLGLLLLMSLGTFMSSLFQAIWIYLMALIIKAFLFGLAPIFISFLLFSKTRHLFDGWINQLVNATLQPVFLFTFFAFFISLIQSAMLNILRVHVCFMPTHGLFSGTPFDQVLPRFTRGGEPYGGPIGWNDVLEISVMDILMFLILTQLAWRFNTIVISLAKEIAAASTNLNMDGALTNMMKPGGDFNKKAGEAANIAAGRLKDRAGPPKNPAAVRQNAAPGAAAGVRPDVDNLVSR